MEQLKQAYPLQWPLGYKRSNYREVSRFRQTFGAAQDSLKSEVERLGGQNLTVSTNMKVNNRGDVYANELGKNISDPGVAIYFKYKGKEVSMCCDKYKYVWENMYALACGIEALRGMERWGVSEFLDRAFTGFTALPPASKDMWWFTLDCSEHDSEIQVKQKYRDLCKIYHPDMATGDAAIFNKIQKAYESYLKSVKS